MLGCMSASEPALLHQRMRLVAEQVRLDFEQSAPIVHSGSKGTVREAGLRRGFLEKYVSSAARVIGSGELVATDGQVSTQCDLMIVEPDTPPLWSAEDFAVVPVECCHVVIEVKSNLTAQELKTSWAAAKKAKSLPRRASLRHPLVSYTRTAYGREWPHAFPLRHIVFGYEGSTLDTLAKELSMLAEQDGDPAMGVDALYVLNRGIVSWQSISTGEFFERASDSLVCTSNTTPGNVLLFMLTTINGIVSTARYNDRFDVKAYVTHSLGQIDSRWIAGKVVGISGA